MDDQFGTLRGAARIRGLVVEAVVEFGICNDDEAVVGERAVDHLLYLCERERDLFFGVERFVGEDLEGADICAFAVVGIRDVCCLPVKRSDHKLM